MKYGSSLSLSFLSGWQKGHIGREGTIGGWNRIVTLEAEVELGREEADAAIEVVVTVGFVGVTDVEVTTETVDNKVLVEAEAAVLEV